jgi:hypothetical protein
MRTTARQQHTHAHRFGDYHQIVDAITAHRRKPQPDDAIGQQRGVQSAEDVIAHRGGAHREGDEYARVPNRPFQGVLEQVFVLDGPNNGDQPCERLVFQGAGEANRVTVTQELTRGFGRFRLRVRDEAASLQAIPVLTAYQVGSCQAVFEMSVAYSRPIEDLDPHGVSSAAEPTQLVGRNVYDTLVTREDDEIQPSLATEWKRPDENTWVFTLRSGVKFHDGKPLTATDAKASLERLAGTEEAPLAPLWESLGCKNP